MNFEPDLSESYVLIIKLLETTRQDKIEWTTVERLGSESERILNEAESAYQTKLGGNLVAMVWENGQSIGFKLVELNLQPEPQSLPHLNQPPKDDERRVLSVRFNKSEASLGKITDESIVYEDLSALIELIKRAPVRSDERIEQAKNYLDQLAS